MTNRVLRLGGELPERADPWQWAVQSALYRIGKVWEAHHLSPAECVDLLIERSSHEVPKMPNRVEGS